jgi:hypothetical protein
MEFSSTRLGMSFPFFCQGHTEREVCNGTTGFLTETYPHYTCSKGFSRWIEKHNRYSTDEAKET